MDNKDKTNNKEGDVLRVIGEIVRMASGGEYIYRGQPDIDYPHVSSTLYRALEKHYKENDDEWREWLKMDHDMNRVQEETLKEARWFASEDYKDKEMLSSIQHYSGDTNLIDFTKDCYVALFFACNQKGGEEGGKNGKVFLLKTARLKKKGSEIEIVTSAHPPNRVTAQKSVFVQSRTGIIPDDEMGSVGISLKLKQPILDYLRAYHGISEYSIYNDLHGYVRNRKAHRNAVMEVYLGIDYAYKSEKIQPSKEKDEALKKAIKYFDKAIRLAPDYATAYSNRGVAKWELGKKEDAMSNYDKAIELNPGYAMAYYNRGIAKWKLEDMPGAISDYDKTIELSPDYAAAYNNRGAAKKDSGNAKRKLRDMSGAINDYKNAISDYNKAIGLNPDYAEAYNNRGVAKWELGYNEGALSDCDKAITLDTNNAEAYNNRGIVKEELGDMSGAKSDYDKAIELNSDNVAAHYNRGAVRGKLGDNEGALSDCNKAITLDPNNAEAYNNRGVAKEGLGDVQGAKIDYDKAIALNPDYAMAYYNRGTARGKLGDIAGAISDYNKTITLDPNNAIAYHNRGIAKLNLGDNEGAIKDFDIAIDFNRSFGQAYLNRGLAFENLGIFKQALSDLENAKIFALQQNEKEMADFAQKAIERVKKKMNKS